LFFNDAANGLQVKEHKTQLIEKGFAHLLQPCVLYLRGMKLLSSILIALVAIEHLYILWLEMFAWTTKGRKAFKTIPKDLFEKTKVMAANQGLYNGFLAIGLIWSLLIKNEEWHFNVAVFFLGCVIVAGVYGAATASKSIFFKQALPAILALIVLLLQKF
jgi:putative membrane protein